MQEKQRLVLVLFEEGHLPDHSTLQDSRLEGTTHHFGQPGSCLAPLVTHKAPLWPGQPLRSLAAVPPNQSDFTRSDLCHEQKCDPVFELSWWSQQRGNQSLYKTGRRWDELHNKLSEGAYWHHYHITWEGSQDMPQGVKEVREGTFGLLQFLFLLSVWNTHYP